MAWVNIDNHPLMASISSRPAAGASLSFIIQRLSPEIVLKEIFEGSHAGTPALDLVKEFNALRTKFENRIRNLATMSDTTWKNREETYLTGLSKCEGAMQALVAAVGCTARINALLPQGERFFYWPWMLPHALSQAAFCKKKNTEDQPSFYEYTYEFESSRYGMVHVSVLFKSPRAGYRIYTQHDVQELSSIKEELDNFPFPDSVEAHCIGVERLPQIKHGGLLSSLLIPSQQ